MTSTLNGRWAFDTHLLIYVVDNKSTFHKQTKTLFLAVARKQILAVIAQQNIIEAERVMSLVYHKNPQEIIQTLEQIIDEFNFQIVTPFAKTYQRFHLLLNSMGKVKDYFDTYLVATLIDNGIDQILTANTKDFAEIKQMHAVNPFLTK